MSSCPTAVDLRALIMVDHDGVVLGGGCLNQRINSHPFKFSLRAGTCDFSDECTFKEHCIKMFLIQDMYSHYSNTSS